MPADPGGDLALHGLVVVEIPLHDQSAVPVDVDVTWAVVTDPGQEHVPAPADLGHGKMLPLVVTLCKREQALSAIPLVVRSQ